MWAAGSVRHAYPPPPRQFDHLYRNDGGKFTEITREAGIAGSYFSLSATWWDYNEDGLPDLYVSNDYMGPDILYRNNGDNTFTDVIKETIPHTPWFSMGSDAADVNNNPLSPLSDLHNNVLRDTTKKANT